jgi:hypothetical protein
MRVARSIPLMFLSAAPVFGGVVAQSQNVLGAYFPSWMFCALAALGATALVRWLLVRNGVEKALPVPVLVYSAMTVAFSLAGWLLWLA